MDAKREQQLRSKRDALAHIGRLLDERADASEFGTLPLELELQAGCVSVVRDKGFERVHKIARPKAAA